MSVQPTQKVTSVKGFSPSQKTPSLPEKDITVPMVEVQAKTAPKVSLNAEQEKGAEDIKGTIAGASQKQKQTKENITKFLSLGILRKGKEEHMGPFEYGDKECYVFNAAEYDNYLKYTTGDKFSKATLGDISKSLGLPPGALREANGLKLTQEDPKYGDDLSKYTWDDDYLSNHSGRLVVPGKYIDGYIK